MVEVRLNPDLAGLAQQVDQFRIEQPLRQRDRHARADADHVDVVDRGQLVDEPPQLGRPAATSGRRPRRSRRESRGGRGRTAIIRSSLWLGASQPSRSMVTRLRVQNRQYIVQTCVVTISTRSG